MKSVCYFLEDLTPLFSNLTLKVRGSSPLIEGQPLPALAYDIEFLFMILDSPSPPVTGILTLTNQIQLKYISSTNQLHHYTQDIVTGHYQGGFKLWECTIDLANYMTSFPNFFQGKRVLDLGCGHGLLGILAQKLGAAEVCLQDYNLDVIQKLTRPTVILNCSSDKRFTFLYGDWVDLKCSAQQYDIIIGSEVIYNEGNYSKILKFLEEFMKPNGSCFLANKAYYFGVGGTMVNFKKTIEKESKLRWESLLKINPEKGGNRKEIIKITY